MDIIALLQGVGILASGSLLSLGFAILALALGVRSFNDYVHYGVLGRAVAKGLFATCFLVLSPVVAVLTFDLLMQVMA